MGWPADVILSWSEYEELTGADGQPLIEEINGWLKENLEEKRCGEFHPLPKEFGNGRADVENIYCGGFNYYFAPDELLHHLRELNWTEPEGVQLFVRDMENPIFEMFTLNDFKSDEEAQKSVALSAEEGQFAGQLFAFDGTLTLLSRAQYAEIIEQGEGHVTYIVSARTTCVIGGENCGEEWSKAFRLGIPTMWESDFHARLKQS